jgi:formylglycine-generating enzyme required for sulfatase activity
MKRCPDCNRTFEDTMSFCLVDGSILSAPFDPNAAGQPQARNEEPAATEILSGVPNAAGLAAPPQKDKETHPAPPRIAVPTTEAQSPAETAPPPPRTIASPITATRTPAETTSAAVESAPPGKAASRSVMKTIVATPPEIFVSPDRPLASSVNETASAGSRARSSGGKWLAASAAIVFAVMLIAAIVWFAKRSNAPVASPAKAQSQQAKETANKPGPTGSLFTENINGVEIKMVSVPGGTFIMGSPASEAGRDQDEGPQRDVTVQSFYMSQYEVTQAQYKAVTGTSPSSSKGDDLPVDSITWDNAVEFCKKLSAGTGRDYRLPTEAQWEFASRAGTTGPWAGDLDAIAWYKGNSESRPHPVGQKQSNGFGLYDMNGNVWEWCESKYKPYPYNGDDGREDLQSNDVRVMRGGSWENTAASCRSAYRRRVIPDLRSIGFRIILAVR